MFWYGFNSFLLANNSYIYTAKPVHFQSSQYSTVPEGENAGLRYPTSMTRVAGVPGSSLPAHLTADRYSRANQQWPHSSTIAIPSRQMQNGKY